MFDSKSEIGLTLPSPDGLKKITVRYPTDAELMQWRRQKKIVQKDLGRRAFQIQASAPQECDLALVSKMRFDRETGPPIDEAEAFYVLSQLTEADVATRPDREGSSYVIDMKIMRKLNVKHTLRIPSVKEMMDYERMRSSVTFGAYGHQEIKINFQAAADLYDKLKLSTEGYVKDIPVVHKAEAINVLLAEIRAEQEPEPEPDEEGE